MLYSARHAYGSYTMEATGNIFAVADSMVHVDVQSMKSYQHHRLDPLREVIDHRNEALVYVTFYVTVAKMRLKDPISDFLCD